MTQTRYQQYLAERYRALLGYTGRILILIGVLTLVPLVTLIAYPDEANQAFGFLITGLPLIGVGVWLWRSYSPDESSSLDIQEGAVVVVVVWFIAILTGAVPFMVNSSLGFSQAVFEATSGWTTTGLSVVDVEEASRMILFYRSFIQLVGGAGFAIIALSAIAGSVSAGLVTAEGRTDKLAPHVNQSANIVIRIYSGYVIAGIVALRLAGMNWFDAVNHAFTAISTGGFSTRAASIGYWDSAAIEGVTIVLMLLGGVNFLTAYTLLRGRSREAARSSELRFTGVLLVIGVTLLFALVTLATYPTLVKSVRVAIFEVVSAVSTTGFTTVDYHIWNDFGWMLLIIFMLIGGGSGSTAGGIKQFRIYVLFRAIVWEIRRAFMSQHVVNEPTVWQSVGREMLDDERVRRIAVFIGLYVAAFLFGVSAMVAGGYPIRESLFEFASTLGTVGLSVGVTAPDMPVVFVWLMSAGMLLGRLEFFAVVTGLLKLAMDARAFFGEDENG